MLKPSVVATISRARRFVTAVTGGSDRPYALNSSGAALRSVVADEAIALLSPGVA